MLVVDAAGDGDFVAFGFTKVKENSAIRWQTNTWKTDSDIVTDNPLEDYLDGKLFGTWVVWNKLYRKSSMGNLRFLPGSHFEDGAFTPVYLSRTAKGVYVSRIVYAYVIHQDSISQSRIREREHIEDYLHVANYLHEQLQTSACFAQIKRRFSNQLTKSAIEQSLKSPEKEKHLAIISPYILTLYNKGAIDFSGISLRRKCALSKILLQAKWQERQNHHRSKR